MNDLFDHPGFMHYDQGGILFEVLHADWPVYPKGHGWRLALQSLAVFPTDVHFEKIDDIDRCFLLVAVGSGPSLVPRGDLYDPKWFHVAVWHEDALELDRRGLIEGITIRSQYEAALDYYNKYKNVLFKSEDGVREHSLPPPDPNDFEADATPAVELSSILLTSAVEETLLEITEPMGNLVAEIRERVHPLFDIAMYDTAVREAGVILESRIREVTATELYGQMLIEEYYQRLCSQNRGKPTAFMKVLRTELRTLFKFVRNDFAHSLQQITSAQCGILLGRISETMHTVNQIGPVRSA